MGRLLMYVISSQWDVDLTPARPQVLAPVVGNDVIVTILPAVLDLAGDNVPNVRFNVAKTLELLINNISDKAVCWVRNFIYRVLVDDMI
jgi:serine/threonine-protein phosphatase 2A regulatory subunit A